MLVSQTVRTYVCRSLLCREAAAKKQISEGPIGRFTIAFKYSHQIEKVEPNAFGGSLPVKTKFHGTEQLSNQPGRSVSDLGSSIHCWSNNNRYSSK